ncbi:MAG: glycosyltransferase family 2 protein, partial [Gemmatimonadota bacterium]
MIASLIAAAALFVYTYVGYPLLLQLLLLVRRRNGVNAGSPADWPTVSIALPAYNEAETIAGTLEHVLAIDYPADRRQIL